MIRRIVQLAADADPFHPTLERARKRAGGLLIEGGFHGLSALARKHPQADPARHGVEVLHDIPYALTGQREHLLDVYRPTRPGPHPVLIYVHGGGFRILSKDTHWVMGLGFARQGYVVFHVNYRLAPKHPFPAAAQDVAQAYGWVLDHAARFGGDPSRLALAGESAGGNLVTSLTISACWERPEPWARAVWERERTPDAVIAACGYLHLSEPERHDARPKPLPTFLRDRIQAVSEGYLGADQLGPYQDALALADVLPFMRHATAPARPLPPFFLPCGTRDPILGDTIGMEQALRAQGAQAHAKLYPGEVHAFFAFVWRAQARQCWADMQGFLSQHMRQQPGVTA